MPPPRPHPLSRSRTAEVLDRLLGKLWANNLTRPPHIEARAVFEHGARGFSAADETFARSPEEVRSFHERLELLTRALGEEAQLNNLGLTIAFGLLSRIVRYRFALGRYWRANPGVLSTPIAPPIIVVGQMRGGTTRIHRLLAADPAHRATRFCNSWHPVRSGLLSPQAKGAIDLFCARTLDPWLNGLHPMGVNRSEEELGWLAIGLSSSTFDTQWRIPSYTAHCETAAAEPIYAEFARILRTDAHRQRDDGRPRILKVPEFCENLPSLLRQFPDARLVVARRDHGDIRNSAVSLVANQMAIMSNACDLAWIEQEWARKVALRRQRIDSFLEHWSGPVTEVDFDKLDADWVAAMRDIYAGLDLDLTDDALGAMQREHDRSAAGPHRSHRLQMAEFLETSRS